MTAMLDRRRFVSSLGHGMLAVHTATRPAPSGLPKGDAHLTARVGRPSGSIEPGAHALALGGDRDGMLYVPPQYRPEQPLPLVLALHGATGRGQYQMNGWKSVADDRGFVVLAPDSRGVTWDVVRGSFGPDVRFVDRALAFAFSRCAVDARRLVISGFSDGASYALSLGLCNGDLFQKIVAFSPGFIVPDEWVGEPKVFLSHGRSDPILPIEITSRRIIVQLQRGGYSVTLREFDGVHEVPAAVRAEAADWMLAR